MRDQELSEQLLAYSIVTSSRIAYVRVTKLCNPQYFTQAE